MKGPYGLDVNDDCKSCNVRGKGFFCQLPPAALKDLDAIKFTSTYPTHAVLFVEKETPRGAYVLCQGEMKLSVSSSDGKTLILKIARAGEVLGLTAALAGSPHEATAEALRPSQVAFIRREAFLAFLAKHPEAYPAVAQQLGAHYQTACDQLRTVALSNSVQGRLAKFLLDLSDQARPSSQGTRLNLALTHEEIGQLIGTSRESVTRTLSDFRHQDLVMIHGSTLTVQNRPALEHLVAA